MTKTATATAAPAKALTFNDIHRAFAKPMVRLFERWEDEREFEREEFLAYFAAIGKKIGVEVRTIGAGRNLALGARMPWCGAPLNIRIQLTPAGEFSVRAVR